MIRAFVVVLSLMTVLSLCNTGQSFPGNRGERSKDDARIELLWKWNMMKALDLDNDIAEKIFQIREEILTERKKLRAEVGADLKKIGGLLQAPPSEEVTKELATTLDRIRKNRDRLKTLWDEHYDRVSELLTVRQQAQLILFMKDFRRTLKFLRQKGRHQRGGPPPPPGPGHGMDRRSGPPQPGPEGRLDQIPSEESDDL